MDFDNLQDVLLKCRCCFRLLTNEAEAVSITELIETSFFDLTQIEVSFCNSQLHCVLKILYFSL